MRDNKYYTARMQRQARIAFKKSAEDLQGAELLKLECKMRAMDAENDERRSDGKKPKFKPSHFEKLAKEIGDLSNAWETTKSNFPLSSESKYMVHLKLKWGVTNMCFGLGPGFGDKDFEDWKNDNGDSRAEIDDFTLCVIAEVHEVIPWDTPGGALNYSGTGGYNVD